jgi:hypothetical protein|tara:strand:+ start:162 stop:284 length:123 start_codon:yes stop_codon:yes gene_type:complete
VSVLNTKFIAGRSKEWGHVVINYGRIMAIEAAQEPALKMA